MMEHRTLGGTGLSVSVLGFGGAEIGYQGADQDTVTRLLNEAIDAGLNVIDTAECYRNSEELIGVAVGGRRKDFHLFTKVGHASGLNLPDWDPRLIAQSIDRSLQRLRTDRVELVQLHSCSEELLRRGEVIEALRKAKAAGKTRFIGYSGDSSAARYAVESGAFDALQTSISIADQEAIELTMPLCRERGVGVIVKRPIANAAWLSAREPKGEYSHEYWKRLKALNYPFLAGSSMLKGDKGAEASVDGANAQVAETALRFTLGVEGVSTMIVGTKRPGRWQSNADVVRKGPLDGMQQAQVRERWKTVVKPEWVGQT